MVAQVYLMRHFIRQHIMMLVAVVTDIPVTVLYPSYWSWHISSVSSVLLAFGLTFLSLPEVSRDLRHFDTAFSLFSVFMSMTVCDSSTVFTVLLPHRTWAAACFFSLRYCWTVWLCGTQLTRRVVWLLLVRRAETRPAVSVNCHETTLVWFDTLQIVELKWFTFSKKKHRCCRK